MANKLTIEVLISDNGTAKLVQRNVEGVGKAAEGTTKKTRQAKKAQDEYNYSLNQGVTGVSSAARSFSKLNQAIGNGPNGLVPAYATLAANAFAVSAAFNALKTASQAEQVMRGLEVQGARLGFTLTNTASSMREISRGSLSMAESMQAAAQAAAAGMNPATMEELTVAAQNASIALGRSMSDSMDRLVKGVTKLEPELLDELGITVKLTEASQKYAEQNNKVVSALTNTEKRQAFLNAVLAEATNKFGGLAQEVSPEPYGQLAAAFEDLRVNTLNFVNDSLGLSSIVSVLANNTSLLASILIMFGSSLARAAIPGLFKMTAGIREAKEALDAQIQAQRTAIQVAKEQANVNKSVSRQSLVQVGAASQNRAVKDYTDAILKTTDVETNLDNLRQKRTRALSSLLAQQKRLERSIQDNTKLSKEEIEVRKQRIAIIETERATIKQSTILNVAATQEEIAARQQLINLELKRAGLRAQANAQVIAGDAIELAGSYKLSNARELLGASFRKAALSIALYNRGLDRTATSTIAARTSTNLLTTGLNIFTRAGAGARVAMFALATGAKVLGAALLNAIPIIGQILFLIQTVVEIGSALWDWLFPPPEGLDRLERAKEANQEILKSIEDTGKQLDRVLSNPEAAASARADALAAMSNKVMEVTQSYNELVEAEANLGKTRVTEETFSRVGIEAASGRKLSDEAKEGASGALQSIDKLRQLGYEKLTESIDKSITLNAEFWAMSGDSQAEYAAKVLQTLQKRFGTVGQASQNLIQGLKEADQEYKNFVNAATVKTVWDGLVTSLQSVESSILDMRQELERGSISFSEFSQQFLSQIKGTSVEAVLAVDQAVQDNLRNVQQWERYVEGLRTRIANRDFSGNDITGQQTRNSLEAAEISLDRARKSAANAMLEVLDAEISRTYELQKQAILNQSAAKILQTQLSMYSEIYTETAAGTEARLKKEEQIRGLQAAQASAQAAALRAQVEASQERLESLNQILLKEENIATVQRQAALDQKKADLERRNLGRFLLEGAQLPSGPGGTGRSRVTQEDIDDIVKYRSEVAQLASSQKAIDQAAKNRLATTQSIRAAQNAIASLEAQVSEIMASNLSLEQKNAEILNARVRDKIRELTLIKEAQDSEASLLVLRQKDAQLRSGQFSRLIDEITSISREADNQIRDRAFTYFTERSNKLSEIRRLEADVSRASSDGDSGRLNAANELLGVRLKELDAIDRKAQLDVAGIRTQTQISLLEKAGLNTAESRLELEIDTLSVLKDQANVFRDLAESNRDVANLQRQLERASRGLAVDTKAEEIEAATLAYELASEEAKFKLQTIELEFALLDAKRVSQQAELEILKEQLIAKTGLTEQSPQIVSLDNAIRNLSLAQPTDTMIAAARQAVLNGVESARLQLQITLQNSLESINESPVTRMINFVQGFEDRRKAAERAATAMQNRVLVGGIDINANDNPAAVATIEASTRIIEASEEQTDRIINALYDQAFPSPISTELGIDPTLEIARVESELAHLTREEYAAEMNRRATTTPSAVASAQSLSEEEGNPITVTGSIGEGVGPSTEKTLKLSEALDVVNRSLGQAQENLKALGPEGELAAATIGGLQQISQGFQFLAQSAEEGTLGATQALQAASAVLAGIQSILNATSQAKIKNIEKEIAAEQKRDGKSAASVAKLDSLEKKKDSIARKAFNTNKKLMMAQAIMSTAAGVAQTLGQGGFLAIPLAIAVGAMGAAQLAIIAGTQYESSYTPNSVSAPSSLSIGRRGDSVDLARGPNYNAGGEVGYLRGSQGMGTNSSNFNTIGSAYGGELMRGYGNRGFVVGEKGPEVITPETPLSVTPANEVQQGQPINATINIQALDSSDVKRVLVDQRGNIISMLREAANANGQNFLEDVNVNVYTRPQVGKL